MRERPRVAAISLEARFFRATQAAFYRELPGYLLALERATPFQDVRGVDVFATVLYPWTLWPVRIPIQLKGSWESVEKWKVTHKELAGAGIIALIIRERDDDATIRAHLSEGLDRRRNGSRRYDEVLDRVFARPLDTSGRRIEQGIMVSRAMEPAFPPYGRLHESSLLRRIRYFFR